MTVLVATVGQYPAAYGDDQNTFDTIVNVTAGRDVDISVMHDDQVHGEWWERGTNMGAMHHRMRNEAAAEALAGGYSHLFLLENDVVLRSDTLDVLVAHDVDIVAPTAQYEEPRLNRRAFLPREPLDANLTGIVEKDAIVTSALLFSQHALREAIPLFPAEETREEKFFGYWHDLGLKTYVSKDTGVDILDIPAGWIKSLWRLRVRDAALLAKETGAAFVAPELPPPEVRAAFRGKW